MRAYALAVVFLLIGPGCAEEFQGRPPLKDGLHYPIATAVDPDSGRLLVVNSNFDLAYQAASLVTYDLGTHKLRDGGATFGAFPGAFMLVDSPLTGGRYGFLAVRGDNSLTWFSLNQEGDELTFVCNDSDGDRSECAGDHVMTESELALGNDDEPTSLGADPYGLGYLPGNDTRPDRIVLAAMKGGQLSLLELGEDGAPTLVDQVNLAAGLHTVGVDPATEIIYLTNKDYPLLYRFSIDPDLEDGTFVKESSVTLPAPYSSVQYSRGMAFADGGQRVLVTYRTPASLLFIDGADSAPGLEQVVVSSVPLGSKPGNVKVAPSGPGGREVAYVPCYGTDSLWAVDVATATPVAEIPVGAGPYDVSTVFTEDYRRAYVTNFLDHTVSVIDIDPTSAFYHTQIAEVH